MYVADDNDPGSDDVPTSGASPTDRRRRLRPLRTDPDQAYVQRDHDLYQMLARSGFAGKDWDAFATVLYTLGFQALRASIYSGRMFTQCGWRLPRAVLLSVDVAEELATDTLAEAIPGFRNQVLVAGRWSPDGGATLKTFFLGYCALQFPNVYRRRLRSDERWAKAVAGADLEYRRDDRGRFADPATQVDLAASLLDAMSKLPVKTREILVLKEMGYGHAEIAELTGLTIKAIESRLDRLPRGRKR